MSNGECQNGEPNLNLLEVQKAEDSINLAMQSLSKIQSKKNENIEKVAKHCQAILNHLQTNPLQHLRVLCE